MGGAVVGIHASTIEGVGSIPYWGTKIPHAMQCAPPYKRAGIAILISDKLDFKTKGYHQR